MMPESHKYTTRNGFVLFIVYLFRRNQLIGFWPNVIHAGENGMCSFFMTYKEPFVCSSCNFARCFSFFWTWRALFLQKVTILRITKCHGKKGKVVDFFAVQTMENFDVGIFLLKKKLLTITGPAHFH